MSFVTPTHIIHGATGQVFEFDALVAVFGLAQARNIAIYDCPEHFFEAPGHRLHITPADELIPHYRSRKVTGPLPATVNKNLVAKPDLDLNVRRAWWPRIIRATNTDPDAQHLIAYGPPGTGKSYDFRTYADEICLQKSQETGRIIEREEVNCTRQTAAAMWLGHWITGSHGEFVWNDGPLARAMKAGIPFIANDIHLCSDDLFDLLMFACDSGARYSLPTGEVLRHGEGYRALLSMNGDPREHLDEPLIDRCVLVPIMQPSKAQIEALDPDVQKLCKDAYQDLSPRNPQPRFSYRTFKQFCETRRPLGQVLAAALVCGNQESARAFLEPIIVAGGTPPEEDEDD